MEEDVSCSGSPGDPGLHVPNFMSTLPQIDSSRASRALKQTVLAVFAVQLCRPAGHCLGRHDQLMDYYGVHV